MFYLVQEFSKGKKVIVSWIFLKKGHLKGVPDGILSVVKREIQDIVATYSNLCYQGSAGKWLAKSSTFGYNECLIYW